MNYNDTLIILGDSESNLYWIDCTDPKILRSSEPKKLAIGKIVKIAFDKENKYVLIGGSDSK